jgi:hypothetical protein
MLERSRQCVIYLELYTLCFRPEDDSCQVFEQETDAKDGGSVIVTLVIDYFCAALGPVLTCHRLALLLALFGRQRLRSSFRRYRHRRSMWRQGSPTLDLRNKKMCAS